MIQKEVMKTSFKKLILIFVLFSVILFFNMLSGMLGGYFYQTLLSTLIILVLITECAAVLWYLVHRQFERNYSLRQVIDSDCIVKLYHDRIEDYTSNFSYVMPCSNIKYVLETKKGIYVTDNLNISICYPAKYMTPINAMRIKDVLYGIVPVKKWRVKGQIQAQLQQPKSIPVLENTEEEVYWSSAISKSVRLKGAWRQFGIILLYILIVTLTFSAVVGIQEAVEYNDPVNFLINFVASAGIFFLILTGVFSAIIIILLIILSRKLEKSDDDSGIKLCGKGFFVKFSNIVNIIPWDKLSVSNKGKWLFMGFNLDRKPYPLIKIDISKIENCELVLEILKEKCGFRIGNR